MIAKRFFYVCAGLLCLALTFRFCATAAHGQVGETREGTPSTALAKYLVPARITALDWLLLEAKVSSFVTPLRWDDYGVISSVDAFAINNRGLVGLTFLLNKRPYLAVPDAVAEKLFADAVFQACGILKFKIPEVEGGSNVKATFIVIDGDVVARYEDGHIRLTR